MIYGDLTPRIGVYNYGKLLKRAVPMMFLERTAQVTPFEKNKGKTVIARRYNRLAIPTAPLTEGAPPKANTITYTDVTATIEQWGDYVEVTDQVEDLHEDGVIPEFRDILGEQMALLKETLDWQVVRGGTNVFYANGTARSDVNTTIAIGDLHVIERDLLAAYAKYYTRILGGTPKIGTSPVAASFVVVGHTDAKFDISALTGYTPVENYASPENRLHEYEVGAVGNFRFVLSPVYSGFADAGDTKGTMKSTTGTDADVYPLVVLTQDAWSAMPLRGRNTGSVFTVNPKPSHSQPLGQLGYIGYKIYRTGMILDDTLMARLEIAVTNTPA